MIITIGLSSLSFRLLVFLFASMTKRQKDVAKAGFTLRTQIYGVYADHFAHLGRVFSATNADLRRRDRAGAECKHSYNTPSFTHQHPAGMGQHFQYGLGGCPVHTSRTQQQHTNTTTQQHTNTPTPGRHGATLSVWAGWMLRVY